jgi:hypothetical protein
MLLARWDVVAAAADAGHAVLHLLNAVGRSDRDRRQYAVGRNRDQSDFGFDVEVDEGADVGLRFAAGEDVDFDLGVGRE